MKNSKFNLLSFSNTNDSIDFDRQHRISNCILNLSVVFSYKTKIKTKHKTHTVNAVAAIFVVVSLRFRLKNSFNKGNDFSSRNITRTYFVFITHITLSFVIHYMYIQVWTFNSIQFSKAFFFFVLFFTYDIRYKNNILQESNCTKNTRRRGRNKNIRKIMCHIITFNINREIKMCMVYYLL